MRAHLPLSRTSTSAPAPGFGRSVSSTDDHVSPRSVDRLIISRLGAGPLSGMYATSVPAFFRASDGWMLPRPTIGELVFHVAPQSSVMAISEKLNPSEYNGT